jgi:2-dehydro-3-deoxyphosphogluconate aldolase/(4S)-4-hydroxy-2-oxoglutarate aldolase
VTAVDLRHGAAAEAIRRHRLIVILRRVGSVDHLVALIEELADAGARIFEVTFDDPAAAKALKASAERLAGRNDGSFLVGAGTIRTEDQLRAATYAGAAFGVSPTFNRELVDAAVTAARSSRARRRPPRSRRHGKAGRPL